VTLYQDCASCYSAYYDNDFEDFPEWHFDTKVIFTAKSAYRVYLQIRDADVSTSVRSEEKKTQWTKI
jgi:hypothetical protein